MPRDGSLTPRDISVQKRRAKPMAQALPRFHVSVTIVGARGTVTMLSRTGDDVSVDATDLSLPDADQERLESIFGKFTADIDHVIGDVIDKVK